MTITSRLVELYEHVKQPNHTMSMDDMLNLGRMRKDFFKTVELRRNSQVQMFKQLLREAKGGPRFSPLTMLTLDNRVLPPMEAEKAMREIMAEYNKISGTSGNSPHVILDALLPLETIEDFHRTLSYMYAFVAANEKLHVVKEMPPPPV